MADKFVIFVCMAKEVKEFLHKINIDELKNELQKDVPSIADLVEIGENGVYKWAWDKADNGARPSYNALIQLLRTLVRSILRAQTVCAGWSVARIPKSPPRTARRLPRTAYGRPDEKRPRPRGKSQGNRPPRSRTPAPVRQTHQQILVVTFPKPR